MHTLLGTGGYRRSWTMFILWQWCSVGENIILPHSHTFLPTSVANGLSIPFSPRRFSSFLRIALVQVVAMTQELYQVRPWQCLHYHLHNVLAIWSGCESSCKKVVESLSLNVTDAVRCNSGATNCNNGVFCEPRIASWGLMRRAL